MMKHVRISWVVAWIFLASSAVAFGQTAVNQAAALAGSVTPSDAPGFPVTLDQAGSYILTSNLTVTSSTNAITITADNVHIDLNGFSVIGNNSGNLTGIGVNLTRRGTSVINGTVRDFGGSGLELSIDSLVKDMVITKNGGEGVVLGSGQVIGNRISENGNHGIWVILDFDGVLIQGNTIRRNGGFGISLTSAGGVMVIENVISANTVGGVSLDNFSGYGTNVLFVNGTPEVSGGSVLDTNYCTGASC